MRNRFQICLPPFSPRYLKATTRVFRIFFNGIPAFPTIQHVGYNSVGHKSRSGLSCFQYLQTYRCFSKQYVMHTIATWLVGVLRVSFRFTALLVRPTAVSARCRLRLKYDGACAETRFRLSTKRTSPFKSAGASVQSTTGSRGVCISGSNAGYTKFRGSVKSTGYPLHSTDCPSLLLPCVTVCHHISNGLYERILLRPFTGRGLLVVTRRHFSLTSVV